MLGDDEHKEGEENKEDKGAVDQAALQQMKDDNEKLKKDLEDVRMEVMTPEYLEYLNSKGNKGNKEEKKEEKKAGEKGKYDGMTPDQIAEAIKKEVKDDLSSSLKTQRDADVQKEIEKCQVRHDDFSTFQPIMYGLSLDPKNKNLNVEELYLLAKEHVTRIHTPMTDKEKQRQKQGGSEKPGNSSGAFKKPEDSKGKSDTQLAEEAWDETVGDKPLPPAI